MPPVTTPTTAPAQGLFARLGSFSARRRWWVIGAWATLLVVMGVFAPRLTKRLSPGGFEVPGSEGLSVQQELDGRFTKQFAATALVVVRSEGPSVDDPRYAGFARHLVDELASTEGVEGVVSF